MARVKKSKEDIETVVGVETNSEEATVETLENQEAANTTVESADNPQKEGAATENSETTEAKVETKTNAETAEGKVVEELPDCVKNSLRIFSNEPELYVSAKTGGVFSASTKPSLVGDAILYQNPYYNTK